MSREDGGTGTLALAGDAIVNRRLTAFEWPELDSTLDRVRRADAAFINLETLLHDYEGYPSATAPGPYMRSPPRVADELRELGFGLVSVANNHTGDYSHGGMLATLRELEARALAVAGLGRNLAEARSPAYVDSPLGRVAAVAACSTIAAGSEAGAQRPDMHGRPGLSPLRLSTRYTVPPDAFERLQTVSERLGLAAIQRERREMFGYPAEDESGDSFPFLVVGGDTNPVIERGDEFAVRQEARRADVTEITRRIEQAKKRSSLVIASLHAHEGQGGRKNDLTVPAFVEEFARECVDAGADLFVGHGPHKLRGIEVYDGAPLFYSLGNFVYQTETIERLPAGIYDKYGLDNDALPGDLFDERMYDERGEPKGVLVDSALWEGVLPVVETTDGELSRVRLYPLDLGIDESPPRRGYPFEAEGELAADVISQLAAMSEPYGTDVEFEDGRGVIDLA